MKKLMTIVGMVMVAVCIMAQSPVYRYETVTLGAAVTNQSVMVSISDKGADSYREIDRVVVNHVSGSGTGVVTFVAMDVGASYTISTASALTPLATSFDWPQYSYVVGTTTNRRAYAVNMLKVNVSQPSHSSVNVYKVGIYAK